MSYVSNALVAIDIAVNVFFGGEEDETISSRVRRAAVAHPGSSFQPGIWIAKAINTLLNLIQRNHGELAEEGDLNRAEGVVQTEDKALGK